MVLIVFREPETISLAYYGLLKNNPDVSIDIVLAILSMRGNLDKSQRAQAEEGCRKMLEQRQKEKERERDKKQEDVAREKFGIIHKMEALAMVFLCCPSPRIRYRKVSQF